MGRPEFAFFQREHVTATEQLKRFPNPAEQARALRGPLEGAPGPSTNSGARKSWRTTSTSTGLFPGPTNPPLTLQGSLQRWRHSATYSFSEREGRRPFHSPSIHSLSSPPSPCGYMGGCMVWGIRPRPPLWECGAVLVIRIDANMFHFLLFLQAFCIFEPHSILHFYQIFI